MRDPKEMLLLAFGLNVAGACVWLGLLGTRTASMTAGLVGGSVLVAQAGLLGAWIALAPSPTPWRMLAAALAQVLYGGAAPGLSFSTSRSTRCASAG